MLGIEKDLIKQPLCEVCKKNKSVGVACIPGLPWSCAYCRKCIRANAHPYNILVSNTALCGGYQHLNKAWQYMIDCTLKYLKINRRKFDADVRRDMKTIKSRQGVDL